MKLHYYPETDSLYIELHGGAGVDVIEITKDFNVDLDLVGRIVGFDIDNAATTIDLSSLEIVGLTHHSNT